MAKFFLFILHHSRADPIFHLTLSVGMMEFLVHHVNQSIVRSLQVQFPYSQFLLGGRGRHYSLPCRSEWPTQLWMSVSSSSLWPKICEHLPITPIWGTFPKLKAHNCPECHYNTVPFPSLELRRPNLVQHYNASVHKANSMNTRFIKVGAKELAIFTESWSQDKSPQPCFKI